jgi:transglutaminase-like putative cysteine protease
MYYRIRHLTLFHYSAPVSESLMEVRMHPRTEAQQRCLDYQLTVTPKAQVHSYRDFLGNSIHHFGVPGAHRQLQITAESVVEMKTFPGLPTFLAPGAWQELDSIVDNGDFWSDLLPSHFCRTTPLLEELMGELGAVRRDDPLMLVRELNTRLFESFEYEPHVTRVDSPIDDALRHRKGVCQDFAHILISILRHLRIPARYVSGYLHHRAEDNDRSSDGATHAWLEAYLPGLGWVGVDPTNNLLAGQRHIRTAVGRDYVDVPPTRGVLKGEATTKLSVAVGVSACEDLPPELAEMVTELDQEVQKELMAAEAALIQEHLLLEQQQQQQQ